MTFALCALAAMALFVGGIAVGIWMRTPTEPGEVDDPS